MKVEFIIGIILATLVALGFVVLPLWRQKATKSVFIFVVLFPVIAIGLYFHWGSSDKLWHYWAQQKEAAAVKAELAKIKNPQQVVAQLKAYLQSHPHSPRGWYLLGRLYLTEGHYAEAVSSLFYAEQQAPQQLVYVTTYAEALFFNNQRHLPPAARQLLQAVLTKAPTNIAANNLLAIDAYNRGQYQAAINYWEKLIPLFAPGSTDSQALLSMIARAQKLK